MNHEDASVSRRALSLFQEETEPRPDDLARLKARLGAELSPPPLLREIPSPTPSALARVRARLTSQPVPSPSSPSAWKPFLLALGAALLLSLLVPRQSPQPTPAGALTGGVAREDSPPSLPSSPSISGQQELHSASPQEFRPTPTVSLRHQGEGIWEGTEKDQLISWTWGHVDVEVEPGHGISLKVETREATVWVVGTGFGVERDSRGTRITVAHGAVQVDCRGGVHRLLHPGGDLTCRPVSAAALLVQARDRRRNGEGASALLPLVDEALGSSPSLSVKGELLFLKAELLAAAQRRQEAEDAARAYLELGETARRDGALRLVGDRFSEVTTPQGQ